MALVRPIVGVALACSLPSRCAIALGIAAWLPGGAAAETIAVSVVAGHPPVFRWVRHLSETFIPAVDATLAGTEHEILWTELYGGSLAPVGGVLETVEEGLVELGLVSGVFEADKLAAQNVTYYTPFVSSDPVLVTETVDALHASVEPLHAAWESNGLEYLGGVAVDDYLLISNFPLDSLDDLDGRKIGAPGTAALWLEGTDAVAVSGNLTTYYTDLRTGVYDGVITFATAALAARLHEVARHVTRLGFGAQYAGGVAANKGWFDEQPEAVRAALKAAGESYRRAYLADLVEAAEAALATMAAEGASVVEADAALRAAWAGGLGDIAGDWARALDERGHGGSEVLAAYLEAIRRGGAMPVRDWNAR